jgi:transcriptional regulator with XRE-family HTH domain
MISTAPVVATGLPLWNMPRMGRPSNLDTPMKRARAASGLTQEQVAERLGVTPTTVQRWEAGLRETSASTLSSLADLYRCSVDEMLGREALAPRATTLPLPSEAQLAVAIQGFASAFFPEMGRLDAVGLELCAKAWRAYLAKYAEDPSRFAEPDRTEFAIDLLSDRFADPRHRATGQ